MSNYKYISKNDAKKLVELEIKTYEDMISMREQLIEVIKEFDGKVINVKFERALKELNSSLRYFKSNDSFEIQLHLLGDHKNTSIKTDNGGTLYLSEATKYLVHYYNFDYRLKEKENWQKDGRFNSSVIIDNLNQRLNEYESTVVKLKEQLMKVDVLIKNKMDIEEKIKEHNNSMCSEILEYFDLLLKRNT